jgi:Serine carboxypeptidase
MYPAFKSHDVYLTGARVSEFVTGACACLSICLEPLLRDRRVRVSVHPTRLRRRVGCPCVCLSAAGRAGRQLIVVPGTWRQCLLACGAGESYAGVYIPMLAYGIVKDNLAGTHPKINLKVHIVSGFPCPGPSLVYGPSRWAGRRAGRQTDRQTGGRSRRDCPSSRWQAGGRADRQTDRRSRRNCPSSRWQDTNSQAAVAIHEAGVHVHA